MTDAHDASPAADLVACPRCGGACGEMLDDGWLACYCCGETGTVTAAHAADIRADDAAMAARMAEERRLERLAAEHECFDDYAAEGAAEAIDAGVVADEAARLARHEGGAAPADDECPF